MEYCTPSCWLVACLGGVRNQYVHFISYSASYCLPCFHLLPCFNIKYLCFISVAVFRKKCRKVIYTSLFFSCMSMAIWDTPNLWHTCTCVTINIQKKVHTKCFIKNIHCNIFIILFLKSFIHVSVDRRVKIQCFITSSSVQVCCKTPNRAQVTAPA